MKLDASFLKLGSLVGVKAGYPFRGGVDAVAEGTVFAVQMKDLDPLLGLSWDTVLRCELGGRGNADWLRNDDLVLVSRGTRFFAVQVVNPPERTVCGPHLFHLRIKPGVTVQSGFLAWQLNQGPFQRELKRSAEGSSQLSVRRPVLESLEVAIPSAEVQRRIVALAELVRHERSIHERLVQNREREMRAIAEALGDPVNRGGDQKSSQPPSKADPE